MAEPAFDAAVDDLLARGPGRMVPDLSRITLLADLMGNPQRAYPSIHVTGTNGKGSAARIVATLLSAAGLSAGTYTSPHLQTIRERMQVSGRPIGEARFAGVHADVAPLASMVADQLEETVTFFEMLTAMAYWWFADLPVDVGVFEVGMGGKWDATNLVRGEVAVLQPIDVDHRELGRTPEDAAREKVGIIKPDATVVCAVQTPAVQRIVEQRAREMHAPLLLAGRDFDVVERSLGVGGQALTLRVGDRVVDDVFLGLHGEHQAHNAAVGLAAAGAFLGDTFDALDDDVIRQGLQAVTVPGRLEVVHRDPTVLVDGAHNPHGAQAAAAAVREAFGFDTLVVVLSALRDKDLAGIFRPWKELANHVIVAPAPSPRSATARDLLDAARDVWDGTGVIVEAADAIADALAKAEPLAGAGDGILVTGSLYAVGAVRDVHLPVEDPGDEVIYEPDDLADEDDQVAFDDALEEMLDGLDED